MHRTFYGFGVALLGFGGLYFVNPSLADKIFISPSAYGGNSLLGIVLAVSLITAIIGVWNWIYYSQVENEWSIARKKTIYACGGFYSILVIAAPILIVAYVDQLGSNLQWAHYILGALIFIGGGAWLLAGRAVEYPRSGTRFRQHS